MIGQFWSADTIAFLLYTLLPRKLPLYLQLFASLSSLGLCTSITTARKGLDRCRTKYDSQVHDWKKTVSTFMDEKGTFIKYQ